MFGYIGILKDELKIKDYNTFQGFYCGLCKTQGKLFGNLSRASLSYDFTFLALLLSSLEGADYNMYKGKCLLHPTRKKSIVSRCDVLEYCSFMSTALAYYKIKDDIKDKTVSAKIAAYPVFAPHIKKIEKKYDKKLEVIRANLEKLSDLESRNIKNIDLTSETFGKIMEEVFDYNEACSPVLRIFGYNIGKWLYTLDAADDFADDLKHGRFNPFENETELVAAEPSVWYNLSEAAKAYELLPIIKNKDLLDNIIYLNLNASTAKIFKKERHEK